MKFPPMEVVVVVAVVVAVAVLGAVHALGETSISTLLGACLAYTFGRAVPSP